MADQEGYSSEGCGCCSQIEPLENALKKCLNIIHDYFGLTDAELDAAIQDAKTNPEWSPFNEKKWNATAYPRTNA